MSQHGKYYIILQPMHEGRLFSANNQIFQSYTYFVIVIRVWETIIGIALRRAFTPKEKTILNQHNITIPTKCR